jgi:hypothetical protein
MLKTFSLYLPLILEPEVSLEESLSLDYKPKEDSRLFLPFDLSPSDMPKNYKPYYNSRLSSIFGSLGLPISPSLKFVLGGGYTEIPFCNHFYTILTQKVHSSQTMRTTIISNLIIFSKWILGFNYISRLNLGYVKLFCCT